MKKRPYKLRLAPGALDFIPKKERAGLMRKLIGELQDGSMLEKSQPVDMAKLKREEPAVYRALVSAMKKSGL